MNQSDELKRLLFVGKSVFHLAERQICRWQRLHCEMLQRRHTGGEHRARILHTTVDCLLFLVLNLWSSSGCFLVPRLLYADKGEDSPVLGLLLDGAGGLPSLALRNCTVCKES